jgi:hypothetical protein
MKSGIHKFSSPEELQKFLNPILRKAAGRVANDPISVSTADPKDNLTKSQNNGKGKEGIDLTKQGKEITYDVKREANSNDIYVPDLSCPDSDGQIYRGDFKVEDNTTEAEVRERLKPRNLGEYEPLEFANPAEMFIFFERMAQGQRKPYSWQIETLLFLGKQYFKENPLRFFLQACNGSGKDSYIIALFAVWFIASKIRSRFIGTSSSYTQLEGQTENYIRTYAAQINAAIGENIFLIKKQHIVCTKTGSEIVLFSTNEPGRAEGWHPHPDYPDAEMCICINEAKTIPDEIFLHLKKCTGYNIWLEVSSPGGTSGHFYNECRVARQWSEGYDGRSKFKRKVTYADCPHISKQEVKDAIDEHGIGNFWVRATYFAEFTDLDSEVVIGGILIDNCVENPPPIIEECPELPLRAGVDFSAGGDEDTIYVFRGNYLWKSKAFREADTVIAAEIVIQFLSSCGFKPGEAENVSIDDGNVGHMLVDTMQHRGWSVSRVAFGGKAINSLMYGNKGTEMWFNVKNLFEQGLLHIPKQVAASDRKLLDQLKGRKYKRSNASGKLILLSKKEQKEDGYLSPDRADGFVLGNHRLRWKDLESFFRTKLEETKVKGVSPEALPGYYDDNFVYNRFEQHPRGTKPALVGDQYRIGKKQIFSHIKRMIGI